MAINFRKSEVNEKGALLCDLDNNKKMVNNVVKKEIKVAKELFNIAKFNAGRSFHDYRINMANNKEDESECCVLLFLD